MRIATYLRLLFARNRLLIAAVATVFFSIMIVSGVIAYVVLLTSMGIVQTFQTLVSSGRSYIAIPPPYTKDLYFFIFSNNVGHFWNPVRIWVWIPLVGAISLGYELLLNAVVIGAVASFVSLTKGSAYAVAGLVPHGVIEIPAFILEFAGLARWHVTSSRAIYERLSARRLDRPLFIEGVKDALALSLLSVAMFAIAAFVESFVTPRFLGL